MIDVMEDVAPRHGSDIAVFSAEERPDLWEEAKLAFAGVWPEYNLHGDVADECYTHRLYGAVVHVSATAGDEWPRARVAVVSPPRLDVPSTTRAEVNRLLALVHLRHW